MEEEKYVTYEVTFKETKEKWIFQYRKSDGFLNAFFNDPKGSSFINLFRKNTFPENIDMIENWSKYKHIVTIELKLQDYSFETLYNTYGLKKKGDLAKVVYEKLDLPTKIKIFNALPKYTADLEKTGQARAHLVTWLRQKRWNDEY